MTKKHNYTTVLAILAVAAIIFVSFYTLPSGTTTNILVEAKPGTELLFNPSLSNNATGWGFGSWRFVSQNWWDGGKFNFQEGKVTMTLSGRDNSFYCINIGQQPHQPIYDRQHEYQVTWRGAVHNAETMSTGALGVGVNLWLDVIKNGQTQEVLELLIFFYQSGFYTIPVGAFKDYGYRGTYWFENIADAPSRDPSTWRFFYFHPVQLEFGKNEEITFSLSECLQAVRENAETIRDADSFRLTEVTAVMELFMAEGNFTTEHLSLKRVY